MSDMRLIEGEEWYRAQHAEIIKLRAEVERLRTALKDMLDWADTPSQQASPSWIIGACQRARELLRDTWIPVARSGDGEPYIWEKKYTPEEMKRATTRPDELIKSVLDGARTRRRRGVPVNRTRTERDAT